MIKDIKELNFPPYATLSQATCTLQDMAEKFITTQVKIDGAVTPDFSHDWEIGFKGEKYIMPLRQPQAAKENTSLNSTIDLTFYHWAQYQLKRHYFFTIQPLETGTAVADKYIASVSLKLDDFCALFNQVLNYYFDGAITIELNREWDVAEEPQTIDISYSYLWDVLIQFYDLWAVRWQIEPKDGNPDKYVIKVGYPVSEVDHIFEYGFKGGLLKVERQVQDDNIRNMLLGRGGEKNLPYRYFKDIDPKNPSFPADPDWIPELRNIYFSELRGKTFRDYVRGWKTNPHRQLTDAEGKPICPYVVKYPQGSSVQTKTEPPINGSADMNSFARQSVIVRGSQPIDVPDGYRGNFNIGTTAVKVYSEQKVIIYNFVLGSKTTEELNSTVEISIADITMIDRSTGEKRTSVGLPAGSYNYEVTFDLYNKSDKKVSVAWTCEKSKLTNSPLQEVYQDFGNPISVEPYDEEYAATSWAYKRGHEDEKFDPVEYVKDDSSIAKYGELMGGLENNEEIYPSIQGVVVDPYGRIDEVVAVEPITSDDIETNAENDSVISNIPNGVLSYSAVDLKKDEIQSYTFPRVYFTVPAGKTANLHVLDDVETIGVSVWMKIHKNTSGYMPADKSNFGLYSFIEKKDIKVYDKTTNEERASVGIPEGSYYYVVDVQFKYISDAYSKAKITIGIENPKIQYSTLQDEKWGNTWDIWVKNIWGSEKSSNETDVQYAERVWRPILGDHEGSEAKVVFSTGDLSTSEDYEFVIAKGGIHFDTSKTLNGVPSHWKLTLGKSDADLESTGLYLPSTMRQAHNGDHFFFVGIDMPHQYVLWAEERLDNYKTDNLDEVKDIKPTWVVSLDKIRISNKQQGEVQPLISQLHVGDSIRLADKRFILNEEGKETAYEILYLQSITYNYREPSSSSPALIPDVEVVLSDKYETIANPIATLSGEVSALSKQVGAMSNVEQVVRAVGDKLYLRKDGIADRSMSPTEFASLVKGRDFRSGIVGGASWGIYQDANGNWIVEADKFKARQELEVNSLVINQIIARGGMIIESAAQIEVTRVVETADGYVCYFDQKMGSVANLFHVDDVAYCNRFTPENSALKFYKRRVMAVSADSITLTDGYEPVQLPDGTTDTGKNGEGIPEVGDTIIQYGNYTDPTRRYVKVRDVINGGYERYLEGLDSVNANGKEYYFAGKQDGQNPRWFIGHNDNNYAEWKNGNLSIKGNINMTAGSSGLKNVEEFNKLEERVDGIDWIHEIFPNGVVDNVATISQLLAVKDSPDEDANIVAGIYGGGSTELEGKGFKDGDRTLMIFAGADKDTPDDFSKAKTRIYDDGTIETNQLKATDATLTNATINGCVYNSMRSPFALMQKYNVKSDNYSAAFNGSYYHINLPESADNNGRRIIIADAKWGNVPTEGIKVLQFKDENTTCRFFEDGLEKKIVTISNEIVELLGYGTTDVFYGWIVLNRKDIKTKGRYGHPLNVMAQGYVYVTGTKGNTTVEIKKYTTFDGQSLSVSRTDTGQYVVTFPNDWFAGPEDYMVMLTGVGAVTSGNYPNKATLYERTTTSFTVWCSDDESRNEGSFFFQIINLKDWDFLNYPVPE